MRKNNIHNILLFLKVFIFISITISASFSSAQEQSAGKIGLHFGYSVADADNVNPYQMSGLTGMARISPSFSFGGYYLLADTEQGDGGRKFEVSIHGIQTMYHVQSGRGDTFFGIRAGISKVRTADTGSDLIFSPYHHGIVSGYDYAITDWLTIGYEGSFLLFRKSDTIDAGTRYVEDGFNTISFMASIKIQF